MGARATIFQHTLSGVVQTNAMSTGSRTSFAPRGYAYVYAYAWRFS